MSKRLGAALAALVLGVSACTGSATVTQTGPPSAEPTEPTPVTVVGTEPSATPTSEAAETPVPDATPTPVAAPVATLPTESFRTDNVLGLSNDGSIAFAGTSSPWYESTTCDSVPTESLAVVDVAAAENGNVAVIGAGLEQAGDVRQVIFSESGSAAILSSCGEPDADPTVWLHRAELAPDGRIVSLDARLDLNVVGESDPFLLRWVDNDTIELRVIIEEDPEDFDTWIVERRQLTIATGDVVSSQQFGYFDDDGFSARPELVTPKGTYRVVDDPGGRLGCEAFGVAATLELDTGAEQRLALSQPDLVFSDVSDLHMTPDGYISWTSGCEGFVSAYVGRLLDDGTIADAHLIETFSFLSDTYIEFQHYRLAGDGFLHAIGQSFDPDGESGGPQFLRYDLRTDPHFVNTADPAPQIDQAPLFSAVADEGTWHVGDTLAAEPACGARTLYGQTAGGLFRAFPAGIEIDAIVDVDVSETRRISFPEGDFVSRTVVVQTECPGSYEGRRVWFGLETDNMIWGLVVDRADLGEVADVLSVRDVLQDGSDFVEASIVQVELLDGSVAEVELVALPAQS